MTEELSPRMSPEFFQNWVRNSKPGWQLPYYEGWLCEDRSHSVTMLGRIHTFPNKPLDELADAVMGAAVKGQVLLFQQRLGEGRWRYLAVRAR